MDNALKILQTARNLIEDGWIKGGFAKDADGKNVSCLSDKAVCFCALGALIKASNPAGNLIYDHISYMRAVEDIRKRIEINGVGNITSWNDSSTKEEVLDVFNTAIQELST